MQALLELLEHESKLPRLHAEMTPPPQAISA
jgi:hypothetical protein